MVLLLIQAQQSQTTDRLFLYELDAPCPKDPLSPSHSQTVGVVVSFDLSLSPSSLRSGRGQGFKPQIIATCFEPPLLSFVWSLATFQAASGAWKNSLPNKGARKRRGKGGRETGSRGSGRGGRRSTDELVCFPLLLLSFKRPSTLI